MLSSLLLCRHLLWRQSSCSELPAYVRLQASLVNLSGSPAYASTNSLRDRDFSTTAHGQSATTTPTEKPPSRSTPPARTARAQAKKNYHDQLKEDSRKGSQQERREAQQPKADGSPDRRVQAQKVAQDDSASPRAKQAALPKLRPGSLSEPGDVNKLVELQQDLLGEAFVKPAAAFHGLLLGGGCKGLQDELAATKSGSILYRQCYRELFDLAEAARARQSGQSQENSIQHSPAQGPPAAIETGAQSSEDTSSPAGSSDPSGSQSSIDVSSSNTSSSTDAFQESPASTASSSLPAYRTAAGLVQKLYITGAEGSGRSRSIALAAFVHWARSQGWVALYLPNAWQLTGGGFFPQHSEGHWDTPESAQLVLHGLMTHHSEQLQRLRSRDGSSTLAELAARGLQDVQGGDVATQMALDVKDALYAQTEVPVLVAIDSYEALYSPCEHGEWLTQHKRRRLDPSELRLADSLRVLEGSGPNRGFVACVDTGSRHKHAPQIPRSPKSITRSFEVPRFTQEEYRLILAHYTEQRLLHAAWRPEQQLLAFYATGGNMKEACRYRDAIIQPGMF